MIDIILGLFTGGGGTLAIIGAALAGLAGLWFHGKRSGRKSERAKQDAERRKARTEADKIDQAVAGNSPDENRKKLKRWERK